MLQFSSYPSHSTTLVSRSVAAFTDTSKQDQNLEMAAYAALVSLKNIMDHILNHPRLSTSLDKYQTETLADKISFLLDFVESNNSHGGSKEAEDLESQIASAAYAAEDLIESHMVMDQIHGGSTEKSPSFLIDLQKMIEDMDSIKENAVKVKEERGLQYQKLAYSVPAASSRPLSSGKTTMVGFDGYLIQILEGLTAQQSNRQIIPIVGMGGIGKTTLARNIYENPLIVQHFDVRVWVTVSQGYNVREIFLETLSCLRESISQMNEETEDQLGEKLYKILSGRRYLIILDDMWSIEAWDTIKFFFPENSNRSRIIVTTRLSNVANHFGSLGLVVSFLDDDESWNLFCQKAFAQESCPPELEEIGKKIVKKCKGLPLSIVVIGGLLGKSSKTQEYWEKVANDITSIMNSRDDNQCLNILSLSYSHLHVHLKPCFLHFGIFPEDHEIRVSQLIKLWVAEGFLKPNKDQSLEEVAASYINDLVDRNLILVRRLRSNGKFKTCFIHDLLRDLCLRVAEKEKFFCIMKTLGIPRNIGKERCIVVHKSNAEEYYHGGLYRGGLMSFTSRLLRALINVHTDSLDTTFQEINMRFLACKITPVGGFKLPSSIFLLWNMQTLIIGLVGKVVAPSEIWEMPQLRHLKCDLICLPDPPLGDKKDDIVLKNLQTLMTVWNFKCSKEVSKRVPNIKKLSIRYADFSGEGETSACYNLYNVGLLKKLESLNYYFHKVPNREDLLQNLIFPSLLKKLSLRNCELHWNDLTMIGSLPHLEVLKLDWHAAIGSKWNPVEGDFLRLKFLGIYSCVDLNYWNADSSHYPVLENLVLEGLYKMDEIPLGIGDIPTLQGICVFNCSVSTAISAIKILEEQESLGNQGLQVEVEFLRKMDLEEFREKVELESFTTHNFQLS